MIAARLTLSFLARMGMTCAAMAILVPGSLLAAESAEALFVRRIVPLFAEKCMACHGQDEEKIKGGLDMRSLAAVLKGGDSELPALVAGKPEESPLYLASLRTHDDWEAMPPKEADKLYADQVDWLRAWIAGGAPWPDEARQKEIAAANDAKWSAEDGIVLGHVEGLSPEWTNRRYKPEGLWAYQPVKKPLVKAAEGHPVDALLAVKELAPAADARTLIRRASFDLTGLPPTPEAVAQFETNFAKDADTAVKQLIDQLLESPHYGERMAQHWLDVVRYADSSGFANDFERGNAWRYRDYVVRAFNSDKPYADFIREQIAGDELEPGSSEKLIATGFLRMGPWELTAMEVAKVARQRFLDDVVNSVGETFLAHSLQCARCHDHKFDPVPTADYYSIQAVFGTTQLAEREADFLPQENTTGFEERRYLEASRADYLATLNRLDAKSLAAAEAWFVENKLDPARWNETVSQIKKSGEQAKRGVFGAARSMLVKQGVPEDRFPPRMLSWSAEEIGLERIASKGLERLSWELERYQPFALAVYNGRTPQVTSIVRPVRVPTHRMTQGELEETCVLVGGDPFSPAEKVRPGVLSVLSEVRELEAQIPDAVEGRRRAFAEWVASPSNPLTLRTIVNRVWMWHFSEPLAGNPNNFGSTGKKPTHPELLDYLAATFAEQGGSFKAMHRLIMTSAAYRRSSSFAMSDPQQSREEMEKRYAVFKTRRLSAEELRDTMLAASGELNRALGGIPVRPEINQEAAMQPRQVMGTFASAWVPNPKPEQRHRRSLYALKLRGLSDPAMEVFNAPAPDFSCERREASTVTPQVFAMFNSQASLSRSLALAARVLQEEQTDQAVIQRVFALLYGRAATPAELTVCLAHWQEMQQVQANARYLSTKPPLEVRRDAVEENTGEKFSFTEKLHANADFIPDLQPADCDARTRALADVCLALLNTNEFAYVY
jgi:mono/diheme cytochrome c family protein